MSFIPVGEQIAIVEGDSSGLILAGPGRGKTVTALAAAARWLARYPRDRALFTSFSNAAVQRLATASGLRGGTHVQFRTFHSIALEVLRDYGRFVGLRAPARALDEMEERLVAAERGWRSLSKEDYTAALIEFARETGRVPFDLMVPWATTLLTASPTLRRAVSARHRFIVVDEFQDTTEGQWAFLKVVAENSRVLALGDEHQMIYGGQFQAILKRFDEFEHWKGIQRTYLTVRNFRCDNNQILDFADSILHGRRSSAGGAGLAFFGVYRPQVRAKLAEIWARFRSNAPEGSRLAFLVPSAKKGEELMEALGEPNKDHVLPIPIRPRMEQREARTDAFTLAVLAAADYRATPSEGTLKKLAVALETFVGLCSRKQVTAMEIETLFAPKSRAQSPVRDLLRTTDPVMDPNALAARLLDAMEMDRRFDSPAKSIRLQGTPIIGACERHDGSLFDGYRNSRPPRMEGYVPSRSRTNMLSMHRCKGREFDYVVMVVDPRAHQTTAGVDELRRLHYVAATRAKRWLGVVYARNDLGPVLQPVIG